MAPLIATLIISSSVSNASTGDLNAQAGDTQNSSYSSVSEQTYMNDEGGSSTVVIETDSNGQDNKQVITKTIPPGGSADIYIATSTGNSHVQVQSSIGRGGSGTESRGGQATSTSSAGSTGSTSSPQEASSTFDLFRGSSGSYFQAFFRNFFNMFRFW